MVLPDPSGASLGAKLRYLRRRHKLTIPELAQRAGVSHNAISRLERDAVPPNPWLVDRIVSYFGELSGDLIIRRGEGDVYDLLVPITDFGTWLRHFRVRKGLLQRQLGEILGVSKVSICRYEKNLSRPGNKVLGRLRRAFDPNGACERFMQADHNVLSSKGAGGSRGR